MLVIVHPFRSHRLFFSVTPHLKYFYILYLDKVMILLKNLRLVKEYLDVLSFDREKNITIFTWFNLVMEVDAYESLA